MLYKQHGANQVHRQHLFPFTPVVTGNIGVTTTGAGDAGNVTQHVNATEGRDSFAHQCADLLLISHVSNAMQGFRSRGHQALGIQQARFGHIHHHHLCALPRQANGRGPADTTAGPGDDGYPLVETPHADAPFYSLLRRREFTFYCNLSRLPVLSQYIRK